MTRRVRHLPGRTRAPRSAAPTVALARLAPLLGLLLLLAAALAACSTKYAEGQALETQGRWEEAMLAYRDAVISDPDDPDYREALSRAEKVVARDNFERYKAFLAQKAFHKAYDRLLDAARQDPTYEPVQSELPKWQRVLVSGQVAFRLDAGQSNLTLADELSLVVRINTPNPGETIDAEIDIDTGTFFAEDLLYNRPDELLTLYTVNSIGAELVYGRTRIKKFTSRDFQRFINIRTPILDDIKGSLTMQPDGARTPVTEHRAELPALAPEGEAVVPPSNPHYSLRLEGRRIVVNVPGRGGRMDFTPRFLYVNKRDRRVLVDFGRYEVRLRGLGERWSLRRLPIKEQDYFPDFSRNIALQPYFFYREGVFTYVPGRSG